MNYYNLILGSLLAFTPLCLLISMYGNSQSDKPLMDLESFTESLIASILLSVSVIGVVLAWRSFV